MKQETEPSNEIGTAFGAVFEYFVGKWETMDVCSFGQRGVFGCSVRAEKESKEKDQVSWYESISPLSYTYKFSYQHRMWKAKRLTVFAIPSITESFIKDTSCTLLKPDTERSTRFRLRKKGGRRWPNVSYVAVIPFFQDVRLVTLSRSVYF